MFRIGWFPQGRGSGRPRPGVRRPVAAISAALLAVSCIERSNPFDPRNSQGAEAIRRSLQTQLDILASGEEVHSDLLAEFTGTFGIDSGANANKDRDNAARRARNVQVADANDSVAAANSGSPAESLQPKQFFWFLDTLRAYGPWPRLDAGHSALLAQLANLSAFMLAANAEHTPLQIYPAAFSDSVLSPFRRDTAEFAALKLRVAAGNRAVADSNASIRTYNAAMAEENDSVAAYNEYVAFMKRSGNWPVITKPDSVGPVFSRVKPGDTVLIGKGVFDVQTRIETSGTSDKPIVISGYPGGGTVLRASSNGDGSTVLFLSKASYIRFQDIVFRGGSVTGVKLEGGSRKVYFQRCVFDSSGVGLYAVDSDVEMLNCRLLSNGIGAYVQGSDEIDYRIRLENVLVARNSQYGLRANSPAGEILNCTLADNGYDGFSMVSPHGRLSIRNTIISGNRGSGIYRAREAGYQDVLEVRECDVWGNQANDWSLEGMDSVRVDALRKNNLNVDPGFKDPDAFDYSLRPNSALAEYERQPLPVIIGYRP